MPEFNDQLTSDQQNLPPVGVDTHAHLDLKEYKKDLAQVIERAENAGLQNIGVVFLGPAAYEQNKTFFDNCSLFFYILGIHPHDAQQLASPDLDRIKTAIRNNARIKAIGEIGLDFYRNRSPHQRQKEIFKAQLEMARENNWPVVVHSRKAEEQTLSILLDMGWKDRPLLWHCFSGNFELASILVGYGWLLSIPGIVTYSNAKDLQGCLQKLPLKHMVLETDCPFLTPNPRRGKRNEPSYLVHTAQKVAELKGQKLTKVWQQTGNNAREFFSLK